MIIGVFGGTFDPPHCGHLGVAVGAINSGEVAEVWFVPCLSHRFGKNPESFEDRIAMCRLLVENEKNMRVLDVESKLTRPGYTYDLLQCLKELHPNCGFRLIAGADIYYEKESWHRYDEVARMAPPLYVDRAGIKPIPLPTLKAPVGVDSTSIRNLLRRGKRKIDQLPTRILQYILEHQLYGICDE